MASDNDILSEYGPLLEALGISTRELQLMSIYSIGGNIIQDRNTRMRVVAMHNNGRIRDWKVDGVDVDPYLKAIEEMTADEQRELFARVQRVV
jgi:hypothetical protein